MHIFLFSLFLTQKGPYFDNTVLHFAFFHLRSPGNHFVSVDRDLPHSSLELPRTPWYGDTMV